MTTKTKSQPPDFAVNMASAEHLFGVPKHIQILAKSRGCLGFAGQRVHRRPLLQWVRRNHRLIAEATAQRSATAADRGEMERLKVRKLLAEVQALDLKLLCDKGLMFLKTEAEELWGACAAIVMEEGRLMMDSVTYREFITRLKARLAHIIDTAVIDPE